MTQTSPHADVTTQVSNNTKRDRKFTQRELEAEPNSSKQVRRGGSGEGSKRGVALTILVGCVTLALRAACRKLKS